jgi:hypothetical protein
VTFEHLREVEASRAFEATKRFDELAYFHVPFDQLNGDTHTEASLTRLVGNGERVAVIGASGTGKSSLMASVLGPFADDLPDAIVPLRVPVAAEQDAVVMEPGGMARHLVQYVTRWASAEMFSVEEREFLSQTVAEATRRSGSGKTREFHIGLPLWLARAEFARQVQSTGQEYESRGAAADSVEALKRMAFLFVSSGLNPVFVFEDSDAWLSIPGLDRSHVANAFFLRTIRMLTKDVEAGLVVAVHEEYLALDGYMAASEWLSSEIRVPRLLNAREGVDTILRDRLTIAEVAAPIESVLEGEAIDWLAKFYESGRTIRDVLRVAQRSLQHALSDGIDVVGEQLVDQAITELAH